LRNAVTLADARDKRTRAEIFKNSPGTEKKRNGEARRQYPDPRDPIIFSERELLRKPGETRMSPNHDGVSTFHKITRVCPEALHWVPHTLTDSQQTQRITVSNQLLLELLSIKHHG
jgi:hypothetical protein